MVHACQSNKYTLKFLCFFFFFFLSHVDLKKLSKIVITLAKIKYLNEKLCHLKSFHSVHYFKKVSITFLKLLMIVFMFLYIQGYHLLFNDYVIYFFIIFCVRF